MSRTYKDAPWMIRAYRSEHRPIDPDWRVRHRRCPEAIAYGSPEWYAWLDDEPQIAPPYDRYRIGEGSAVDRTLAHRRYRSLVRDAIAHEDFDSICAPSRTKYWFNWRW